MSNLNLSDSDIDRIADVVEKRIERRREALQRTPVTVAAPPLSPNVIAEQARIKRLSLAIAEQWYASFGSDAVRVRKVYEAIELPSDFVTSSSDERGRMNALGQFIRRMSRECLALPGYHVHYVGRPKGVSFYRLVPTAEDF